MNTAGGASDGGGNPLQAGMAGKPPPAKMKRKQTSAEEEHRENSRMGRELLAYCLFLILFCVVTVVPIDDPNYEGLSYAMRDLMLETDHASFNTNASFSGPKFASVASVSDYWKWLRGPFLHAIYMSDWYSGSPWAVGDQGMVAGNNLIVGTVRLTLKFLQPPLAHFFHSGHIQRTACTPVGKLQPGVHTLHSARPFSVRDSRRKSPPREKFSCQKTTFRCGCQKSAPHRAESTRRQVNIRQKRVVRASCQIPVQFVKATTISDCVADFAPQARHPTSLPPKLLQPFPMS